MLVETFDQFFFGDSVDSYGFSKLVHETGDSLSKIFSLPTFPPNVSVQHSQIVVHPVQHIPEI